jgi:hypothetical protein
MKRHTRKAGKQKSQPRRAPPQPAALFMGRWSLVNDKGVVSSSLTLTKFGAKRDHAPNYPGTWVVVGREARITWEDGFRDILRLEDSGSLTMLGLGKAARRWDSMPILRLQAIRVVPPTPIPTGEKCRHCLHQWQMQQRHEPKLLFPELYKRVEELLRKDYKEEDQELYLDLWEETKGGTKDRIPPERRTIPMTKQVAARLLGLTLVDEGGRDRRKMKDAVELLTKSMGDGIYKYERQSRQRYVFDREDFPIESHPKIIPGAKGHSP